MKRALLLILLFLILPSMLFAATGTGNVTNVVLTYMGASFNQIYELFDDQMNLSFKSVRDNIVPKLLGALILLELLWICIQGILQKAISVPELLIKLFITLLIIVLTQNMNLIVQGLSKMFSRMAMVAGDSGYRDSFIIDAGGYALFKPSDITTSFRNIIEPLDLAKNALYSYAASVGFKLLDMGAWFSLALPAYIMAFICTVVQIILFIVISFVSLSLTFWLIEFIFLLVVATVLLPWQVFSPTKFVSTGIWQALFGQAIKLFCIVFMVSIGPSLFERISALSISPMTRILERAASAGDSFPTAPVISVMVLSITLVISYCYFLMKGPALAKAIIVGQPVMETLGTHYVARMGGNALGAVWMGAKAVTAGIIAKTIGTIFHRRGSSNDKSSNDDKTNPSKFQGGQ